VLNYQLFQKFKLIRRGKFNHLTITLTPPSRVGSNSIFNSLSLTREIFNLNGVELIESKFNPMTFGSDTIKRIEIQEIN
jgi:hypothetical protein